MTEAFAAAFPGAVVGALAMSGVLNPEVSPVLEARKQELEKGLRSRGSDDIGSDPVVRAYVDYYRGFGKTYHVKAQWESVAVKGKPIPRRAALVETMFMAELENLILTAGHDLATLALPLCADVTGDGDRYELLNGTEKILRDGDMAMRDGEGIVSSVLNGPDQRTRITPETREVLFAVYAPAGVGPDAVRRHLEDIRANVLLVAPDAATELLATVPA